MFTPHFDNALARSLRARVDARLVNEHGHDRRLALGALGETQTLVDAHPDVPEFRGALATVQIAPFRRQGATCRGCGPRSWR